MLAILFSFVFFETIGYHPVVIGLMLAVFIPVTVFLKITPGIATSSVIILNLYSAAGISPSFIVDQFLIIIIGIGTGLLLNLYMPSLDKNLKEKQKRLEENFRIILYEIALYIRNKEEKWDGKEITDTESILEEATDLVERDRENHLFRNKHPYKDYFHMRTRQFELLQRMLPLVTKLPNTDKTSENIARFFEALSEAVTPQNRAEVFLEELNGLRKEFDSDELPATREEFETRANLFRLLHDIEDYLILKKKYKPSDVKKSKREQTKTQKSG